MYKGPIRRKYDGSGSQQRMLDALKNRKNLETDPDKMKTYPRIPFQRSISLRPRATPMEAERYFQLNFEQDLDDWIKKGFSAPSVDELAGILNETSLKKLGATEVKVLNMGQGNKLSRIVAWTFVS